MFNKRSTLDIKKSTLKIQDSKKDSAARLKHIKSILEHVDIEEAKSLFETNYSHVYYVLYDTFIQAENNLKQRVHKTHREELDGSLWLLGKILCLLPELIAKRWQCHSLGRIMAKLLHHGNCTKIRKEGVRYFLLWYQALAENNPPHVHKMFKELVPGLSIPQKGALNLSDPEHSPIVDVLNHPNLKGEMGASVFHDTGVHPVRSPEIVPLIPPSSTERSASLDAKDGLETLLECMVQTTGCLKWRDDTPQRHQKCFAFLLQRFQDIYLPVFCPNFDVYMSVYKPRLDLPVMRMISKYEESMSPCVVVLINWVAKHTREKTMFNRTDLPHYHQHHHHPHQHHQQQQPPLLLNNDLPDDVSEYASLLTNVRYMGYSQAQLIRDVLYSTRENVNFVNEVYRQAFLLGFATKSQIGATRTAIAVYKDWMGSCPPPFFFDPVEGGVGSGGGDESTTPTTTTSDFTTSSGDGAVPVKPRLRNDSYLGAISKEHLLIRAGTQNVLQSFVTHAANVFMVQTAYLNVVFQSKTRDSTPLDEQTDICKSVLNMYRTMVMNTRMEEKTWEQLLLVLLQITAVILSQVPPNSKRNNLGGRLAQPVFQTLIVTWIRAHTNVVVNIALWKKFLNVLSSLTHREELIIEWDKTMQTLTRVMARQVYNLNLQDLPLDRLTETKGKRRKTGIGTNNELAWHDNTSSNRYSNHHHHHHNHHHSSNGGSGGGGGGSGVGGGGGGSSSGGSIGGGRGGGNRQMTTGGSISSKTSKHEQHDSSSSRDLQRGISIPGTPYLNRSYSEGSLAPFRKSRPRKKQITGSNTTNSWSTTAATTKAPTLSRDVEFSLNRMMSSTPVPLSISCETLNNSFGIGGCSGVGANIGIGGAIGNNGGTLRRAISLDSIKRNQLMEDSESARCSRTPSPTASSGIEGGSIKDSPMQIDAIVGGDGNSIDAQELDAQSSNNMTPSVERRSILTGGTARGWLPDVAAVMWKRMLGGLGDVNQILNPKLHAQVFKHLLDITENLLKIRLNQGISSDNLSTPTVPSLVPPVGIVAPWCYGALVLDAQYREGKLWALQLLCTIARYGPMISHDQLPLFYHSLHQALTCEDRGMSYTVLRCLGGSRILSLLLPGHSLLLLDLVHASTVILTSFETNHTPRSEAASLLGALLCFPKTALPKPVLQPNDANLELMECADLQEHILNVILRCARRESTSKARCIAISALGQWILQNLNENLFVNKHNSQRGGVGRRVSGGGGISNTKQSALFAARLKEAIQVILQALQFKHRNIARVAAETLKLFAEKGKELAAQLIPLTPLIINALCVALEIQNVAHPKESDKVVLTALLLCLGEFCMTSPIKLLVQSSQSVDDTSSSSSSTNDTLIENVLRILHQIATGIHTDRIKLFTADEDFDMSISVDDVKVSSRTGGGSSSGNSSGGGGGNDSGYQAVDSTHNNAASIQLCATSIAMHLVTNLGHFPMGIGATRLSTIVDEQDDMIYNSNYHHQIDSMARESLDLDPAQILNASNIQIFLLNKGLVSSLIELPALKLPGGGITAGLITASKQVRVLLRDLNGKECWDVSILYKEPNKAKGSFLFASGAGGVGGGGSKTKEMVTSETSTFFSKFPNSHQSGRSFMIGASLDPMQSTMEMPMFNPLRHTMRHRLPNQLPLAKDMASDLDQLDDLLQYIGHTSPECLDSTTCNVLNSSASTPLSSQIEAQTIGIILNQKVMEDEYIAKQHQEPNFQYATSLNSTSNHPTNNNSMDESKFSYCSTILSKTHKTDMSYSSSTSTLTKNDLPFHYARLLFSQLGLAGWERRKRTHLLLRTEKLLRELRNVDKQRCRETHKIAVIYVASGQEDKNSILSNSCGSGTYEMFVSALGWEVELESHNGFLGGLPRQGCGSTSPYYATPLLEVIYHVATRMPYDNNESILNKTRHLGNDEVHIVWSEHHRDYRRDILPTEFCDVLIVVYPLKSGLFRVTVSKKPDVPWFGPLYDETVVGGSCLASLVRATALNASRAKRTSLPFFQQFYEERKRSLETIDLRHKEINTFEDFAARIYNPIPIDSRNNASVKHNNSSSGGAPTLAAALTDHHRSSIKSWHHHPEVSATARELSEQTLGVQSTMAVDYPSPRSHRKLHPFKSVVTKQTKNSTNNTPPDSPTLPGRRFK